MLAAIKAKGTGFCIYPPNNANPIEKLWCKVKEHLRRDKPAVTECKDSLYAQATEVVRQSVPQTSLDHVSPQHAAVPLITPLLAVRRL